MRTDREGMEDVYRRVPAFLQNLALSGYGLHTRLTRYNGRFYRLLEELQARDVWSGERTTDFLQSRLQGFVQHAAATVPYYRELFDDLRIDPRDIRTLDDLARLPVLDRSVVRERADAFLSSAVAPADRLEKFTSGTTGAGLRYVTTTDAIREQWAVWWRFRRWHGIRPRTKCAMFRSALLVPLEQTSPPFWRINHAAQEIFFSGNHMSPRYLPFYVDEMNRRRPPWIHGFGSTVTALASFIIESGCALDYPVRWITLGSEQVYPHQIETIERAFGVRPLQLYGMTEAVANISEAPDGKLYVDEDFAAVEFLEKPGESSFEVIGTNLSNPAFPLLRYRVGDMALADGSRGANGRRIVARLEGRSDDYIIRPDGSRLGRLDILFRRMVNIREAQLHQQRIGAVTIRIVRERGYSEKDEDALLAVARKHIGADTTVALDYVDRIERSPSGKLRHVISELDEGRL